MSKFFRTVNSQTCKGRGYLRANILIPCALLALIPSTTTAVGVADSLLSDVRPYLSLRVGADFLVNPDAGPDLKLQQQSGNPAGGISIGADLGRYLGVEAALDYHKTSLEHANGAKIGDYSLTRATGELRLRYPLQGDRLVPYALLGGGVGQGDFSGREDFAFNGGGHNLDLIGVAGIGVDYFLVDNIALTAQAKYVFGFDTDFDDNGTARSINGDSVEVTAGLRAYADHLGRHASGTALRPATDTDRARAYLAIKGGRGFFTDPKTVPGVKIDTISGLLGEGGLGYNFNRHWGVEFDVNYTRAQLHSPTLGDITGYPVFTYTLLGRYRYPLMADRLVPYLAAGGGVGFGETGDRDQPFSVTHFSGAQDYSYVASVGAGVDYFLEDNFSIGVEAKYTTPFSNDVALAGVPGELSPDFLALTAGVRLYYP